MCIGPRNGFVADAEAAQRVKGHIARPNHVEYALHGGDPRAVIEYTGELAAKATG